MFTPILCYECVIKNMGKICETLFTIRIENNKNIFI